MANSNRLSKGTSVMTHHRAYLIGRNGHYIKARLGAALLVEIRRAREQNIPIRGVWIRPERHGEKTRARSVVPPALANFRHYRAGLPYGSVQGCLWRHVASVLVRGAP
jgi:hypothetical protein